MKPFRTIDEQIEILKTRNLKFNDIEKAKRYLLNNNYYDVINQYSKFFMPDVNKNIYDENVSFENIIAVHNFDKDIKNIFLSAIIEAEKQFKSIIAYRYCEVNNKVLNSYLYLENYCYDEKDKQNVLLLIKKITDLINNKKAEKLSNSIKHYIANNNNIIPFWVLSGFLTLGLLTHFYKYLPLNIKNKITKDLAYFVESNVNHKRKNFITPDEIYKVIENMRVIRNISAHNNKFLGHVCEYDLQYNSDIHAKFNIDKKDNRQSVYNVFIALQYFLDKKQFANVNNRLRKKILLLQKRIEEKHFNKIINSIGFPKELMLISDES